MKSSLALALLLVLGSVARADDPMPTETTAIDDAGTAGENATPAPVAEPAPTPAPVTSTRARMTVPTSSPRAIRARIQDDGEGRLDKKEDTVAGGTHWRIKTAQGAVHVWIPANYDRATAGTVVYVHGYWTEPTAPGAITTSRASSGRAGRTRCSSFPTRRRRTTSTSSGRRSPTCAAR